MLRRTPNLLAKLAMVEFWEHHKKLQGGQHVDASTVRLQGNGELVALLNDTVEMKQVLDQFLVAADGAHSHYGAASGSIPEKGWWHGSFTKTKKTNRLAVLQLLADNGWDVSSTAVSVEREWMIYSCLLKQ